MEIAFGPELLQERQAHFVPEPMKRGSSSLPGQWRAVAVAAVVIALGVLAVAQFTTGEDMGSDTESVAEVPEDILADMRRLLMPNAQNFNCLQAATPLGCLQDSRDWRTLVQWLHPRGTSFAEKTYEGALPEAPQKVVAPADEDEADEGSAE